MIGSRSGGQVIEIIGGQVMGSRSGERAQKLVWKTRMHAQKDRNLACKAQMRAQKDRKLALEA